MTLKIWIICHAMQWWVKALTSNAQWRVESKKCDGELFAIILWLFIHCTFYFITTHAFPCFYLNIFRFYDDYFNNNHLWTHHRIHHGIHNLSNHWTNHHHWAKHHHWINHHHWSHRYLLKNCTMFLFNLYLKKALSK